MNRSCIRIAFCVSVLAAFAIPAAAQTGSRTLVESNITDLRRQLQTNEAAFLAPGPEDLKQYGATGDSQDAGVIRLLPREKYEKLLTINGGGAYYSFARNDHAYGHGNDVELSNGELSVGFAGADYGFIAKLGDLPLADVSANSAQVRWMVEYATPLSESMARAEYRRFGQPTSASDALATSRVKAEVGQTYAVRSICYDDSDVLVAFRVVRQDADGSLILTWKMLQRFPAPKLERPVQG